MVIGLSMMLGGGGDLMKSIPNLFAYWNAENAVYNGSNVISKLADQSGNVQSARDLTPVSTGPTYTAVDSTFNGRPSISSSSANIRLQATFDTSISQPYTVYLVMNIASNAGTMFWRTNAGNQTGAAGFVFNGGPGTAFISVHDSSLAVTSVGSVSTGNAVTCCTYDSAGVSAIFINDSASAFAASPSQGSLDADACAVMTIGNFGTADTYSWTLMACYSGAHSAATRKTIMSFLGSKYGIVTT